MAEVKRPIGMLLCAFPLASTKLAGVKGELNVTYIRPVKIYSMMLLTSKTHTIAAAIIYIMPKKYNTITANKLIL